MAAVAAMQSYPPPPTSGSVSDQHSAQVHVQHQHPSIFSNEPPTSSLPVATSTSSRMPIPGTVDPIVSAPQQYAPISQAQHHTLLPVSSDGALLTNATLFSNSNLTSSGTAPSLPPPHQQQHPQLPQHTRHPSHPQPPQMPSTTAHQRGTPPMSTPLLDMVLAASSGAPSMDGPHFMPCPPGSSSLPLFADDPPVRSSPAKLRTALVLRELEDKARKAAGEEYDAMLKRRGDAVPTTPRETRRRVRNKCAFVSRQSRRHYADLLASHLQTTERACLSARDECAKSTAEIRALRATLDALAAQLRPDPPVPSPF